MLQPGGFTIEVVGLADDVWAGLGHVEDLLVGERRHVVMNGHHLLHTTTSGESELYRYRTDTSEQEDIAQAQPDQVDAMLDELREWQASVGRAGHTPPTAGPLDPPGDLQLPKILRMPLVMLFLTSSVAVSVAVLAA